MAKEKEASEDTKKTEKVDNSIPSGTMVMCDDGVERPVITRAEAMEAKTNRYFTGIECQNGHMTERKVKGYVCVTCARERAKARKKQRMAEDPDYKAKLAKKRADKHKERYANDPEYRQKVLDRAKVRRQKAVAEKAKNKAEQEIVDDAAKDSKGDSKE